MRRIPPRRLIFSGGGIRVISYLGVIQVLKEHGLLKHVKEFCGVSAGALVALMLALEYKLHIIENFCFQYDFSEVRSVEPEDTLEFLENYGVDNGEKLQTLIEKILKHKGHKPTATFADLAAGGVKSIRMWASDIQNMRPIEFSAAKTPNIQVSFALRASMAVPFYFIPLRHPETNTLLVDGAVFDNYPISHLTDSEAEDSLGLTFGFHTLPQPVDSIGTFLGLINSGYYIPSYKKLLERHTQRTIVIPCNEFPALHFEATVEERQLLVTKGRQAAEDFFTKGQMKPQRRHSVS
jgi:predicted acylesterase/phospholipase RssA